MLIDISNTGFQVLHNGAISNNHLTLPLCTLLHIRPPHFPHPPPKLPHPWHKFLLGPTTPILPPLSPFLPHIILGHLKKLFAFYQEYKKVP